MLSEMCCLDNISGLFGVGVVYGSHTFLSGIDSFVGLGRMDWEVCQGFSLQERASVCRAR